MTDHQVLTEQVMMHDRRLIAALDDTKNIGDTFGSMAADSTAILDSMLEKPDKLSLTIPYRLNASIESATTHPKQARFENRHCRENESLQTLLEHQSPSKFNRCDRVPAPLASVPSYSYSDSATSCRVLNRYLALRVKRSIREHSYHLHSNQLIDLVL